VRQPPRPPEGRTEPGVLDGAGASALAELAPGVELRENLRFDPREEANDDVVHRRADRRDRPVRERRVRRLAPSPCVDRRSARRDALGDGSAAAARGRGAPRAPREAQASVRGGARRRQDLRQARRDRGVAEERRRADDRRGDVLHVLRRAGQADRRLAVRARPGRLLRDVAPQRRHDPPPDDIVGLDADGNGSPPTGRGCPAGRRASTSAPAPPQRSAT
jgi:hypothetical protein